jgi:hypothetical protein
MAADILKHFRIHMGVSVLQKPRGIFFFLNKGDIGFKDHTDTREYW